MDSKIEGGVWWWMQALDLGTAEKMAYLWTLTNNEIDILGCFTWNKARFQSETQLPASSFEAMLEKLQGKVQLIGNTVWVKNYMERQLGRGGILVRNNMTKGAIKALFKHPKPLQEAILAEYPELAALSPYQPLAKPLPTPSTTPEALSGSNQEGLANPLPRASATLEAQEKRREEQRGEEYRGSGGESEVEPTLEDVLAAASMAAVPEDAARKFFEHYDTKRLWRNKFGQVVKWRTMLISWKVGDAAREFQGRNQPSGTTKAPWPLSRAQAQARYDTIDSMLPTASETEKVALIREQSQLSVLINS